MSSKANAELDGVWVPKSGGIRGSTLLPRVWESVLVLREGVFHLTRYCGEEMGWTGTFAIGADGNPRAVDVAVAAADFSEMWPGVVYPASQLKGICEVRGGELRVCLRLGEELERPTEFESKDAGTVVAIFERAVEGYAGVPKEVVVEVADEMGRGVGGATVFDFMRFDKQGLGGVFEANSSWHFNDLGRTEAAGVLVRTRERQEVFAARDELRQLMGIVVLSPAVLQHGRVRVVMGRTSEVRGRLTSDVLEKLGKPIGWVKIRVLKEGEQVAAYEPEDGCFSMALPAGEYVFDAYGENLWRRRVPVVVGGGGEAVEMGRFAMPTSQRVLLEGKLAPELKGIVAWRGKSVTFAELRGNVVLVEFWGSWCGPCVRAMPTMMALHEKYGERGLAVVGVHVGDMVTTAAQLEEKMEVLRKEAWNGREVAFPVAIADGKELQVEGIDQPVRGEAAAQYGIMGYPTTIVIDRDGRVAGQFYSRKVGEAEAEVEKLLAGK